MRRTSSQADAVSLAELMPCSRRLHGARVVLRRFVRSDGVALYRCLEANRSWLAPWMRPLPEPFTIGDVWWLIRSDHARLRRGERLALGVFAPDSGQIIGHVALHTICLGIQRSAGLGYWVDEKRAGHGLMREAVAVMTAFAFEELDLNRVWAGIQLANTPSRRLIERLGFTHEGIHRQELFIAGDWRDQHHYALLRDDYPDSLDEWIRRGWLGTTPC